MKWTPWPYQRRTSAFIQDNEGAAVFLDMGMGKTTSTLTAAKRLLRTFQVTGVLVVAPLRVVQLVWRQEAKKWDHLKDLTFSTITGSPASRTIRRNGGSTKTRPSMAALQALATPADIYLINYECFNSLCDWMSEQERLPFDMIVFDESSKMKSPSSKRFKLFKQHIKRFDRRVILTGTPTPAGYEDLWSQYYLLDGGERLGKFVSHFRDQYFVPVAGDHFMRRIRRGAKEQIQRKIADITICLRADDHLSMPKIIYNYIEVELPPKVRDGYERFEREMFLQLESTALEAFNAAALSSKCRQYTSGAIYEQDENGATRADRRWALLHDAKLDALADIIDDAQGSQLLVAYEFKHELQRLKKRWPTIPVMGETKDLEGLMRRWDAGEVPVIFIHPASVGHGINFQYGGHILVWTSSTWSLELYEQTVARIYRQGQEYPVMIHHLVVPNTVDVAVRKAIDGKAVTQADLKGVLAAYRAEKAD